MEATHKQFQELKKNFVRCREKSKNEYDYFNLVERSILGMEEDETPENEAGRSHKGVQE
jgi:hypothetical protein